jgi:hypothetical protein
MIASVNWQHAELDELEIFLKPDLLEWPGDSLDREVLDWVLDPDNVRGKYFLSFREAFIGASMGIQVLAKVHTIWLQSPSPT